jgi:uncharacterized repeat protein (TIGR03987 family)
MPGLRWVVQLIVTALVCYTIAVWSERFSGRLKGWHLVFFWAGLAADLAGTTLMAGLAGGLLLNLHGVTGITALTLMLVHTVWATVVLARRNERAIVNFHRFSMFVWLVWLVPFVTGALLGMGR